MIRFIYRLVGRDDEFTPLEPGGERSAVYRGLPPGDYEFRVIAIGRGGSWSRNTGSVKFSVNPPFYLSSGFILAAAAVIVIAVGSVFTAVVIWRKRKERRKYSTTRIDRRRREEAMANLESLMEKEKVFLDPDLTLGKLSKRLKIHSNYLSRIVNQEFGQNFNDYINRYRIEEACRMLREAENAKKNITDIMYRAGFYSKSTFNTAFRRVTGTTPSKYRRDNL
jgi:AraC-like DNA-binding protein